jgi:ParB-like nuclease domain
MSRRRRADNGQSELGLVEFRLIDAVRPAPENNVVYQPVSGEDPGIFDLARSIKEIGIQEPIVVSTDGFIISGHRRHMAAKIAELVHVPVRVHPVSRSADPDGFLKMLVSMNSQRVKTTADVLHETIIKTDPTVAFASIVAGRERKAKEQRKDNTLSEVDPVDSGRRCELTEAKQPFIDAVLRVLAEQREYWPLSDRQIHYRLLGEGAPLIHASKPESRYQNDKKSYRALTDVCARGRVAGIIPWNAIEDSTRPSDLFSAFRNPTAFFQHEFNNFLDGYWRNLLQSQPHHIEIVAEKLTVQTILESVAREHTMPLTISRGMASLPPKRAIYGRYRNSGKGRLILLIVSDLDPAGDAIAADLVKCFRRDFGVQRIDAYKVALTIEQVEEFDLTPSMEAKESSPTYQEFIERYGIIDAYELEAMEPADLADSLTDAIEQVIDCDAFNAELRKEKTDSAEIVAVKRQAMEFFRSLRISGVDLEEENDN